MKGVAREVLAASGGHRQVVLDADASKTGEHREARPVDVSAASIGPRLLEKLGNEVDDLIKRQADMAKQYSQKLQEINFTCTQTPQK